MKPILHRIHPHFLLAFLLAFCTLFCTLVASAETLEKTFQQKGVTLTLRATPSTVSPLDDVALSLELIHPTGLEVRLPTDFSDRFEGLTLIGSYEGESITAGDSHRREFHLQARPIPGARRYRIAPFPIRWTDPTSGQEQWFPTQSILLQQAPVLPPEEAVSSTLEENLQPVRIHRSPREILLWVGYAALTLLAAFLLALLIRFLRHCIRVAKMSPRERALHELQNLLNRHLPEHGRYKEFYVELTHVVRRYIERRHGILAPKQTTEEFLRTAAESNRFPEATLARLKAFLSSADLIKFAGVPATEATANEAVQSARTYLEAEPKESSSTPSTIA